MDANKLDPYYFETRKLLATAASGKGTSPHSTLVALGIHPNKKRGQINDTILQFTLRLGEEAEGLLRVADTLPQKRCVDASEKRLSSEQFLAAARSGVIFKEKIALPFQRTHAIHYIANVIEAARRYHPSIDDDPKIHEAIEGLSILFRLLAIDAFDEMSNKWRTIGESAASRRIAAAMQTACEIYRVNPLTLNTRIKQNTHKLRAVIMLISGALVPDLIKPRNWPSNAINPQLDLIDRITYEIDTASAPKPARATARKANEVIFAVEHCGVGVKWDPSKKRIIFAHPPFHALATHYEMDWAGSPKSPVIAKKKEPRMSESERRFASDSLMTQLYKALPSLYPAVTAGLTLHSHSGIMLKNPPLELLADLNINPKRHYDSHTHSMAR